jgi:hypothetical protein
VKNLSVPRWVLFDNSGDIRITQLEAEVAALKKAVQTLIDSIGS